MEEKWPDMNLEGIEKYLALIILMELHHMPEYKDHFSKEQLLGSPKQKFMTQCQYEKTSGIFNTSEVGKKGKVKNCEMINDIMSK